MGTLANVHGSLLLILCRFVQVEHEETWHMRIAVISLRRDLWRETRVHHALEYQPYVKQGIDICAQGTVVEQSERLWPRKLGQVLAGLDNVPARPARRRLLKARMENRHNDTPARRHDRRGL